MVYRPLLAFISLAGALCLAFAAGAARAQVDAPIGSGPTPGGYGDQYRCDRTGTRCATFRCDPGQACARTGDWEPRDYSRGVDGDAPAYDNFTTGDPAASTSFDRRYDRSDASGQGYDRRFDAQPGSGGYDERYTRRQGQGYDEDGYDFRRDPGGVNDYARNSTPPTYAPTTPPADETATTDDGDRDGAVNDRPGYSYERAPSWSEAERTGGPEWRCTDGGLRCAYFRCDDDGEDCHRISGWSSRADADRRPDYDGW
ncbi:MAG: hypothetical protein JSR86_05710 [Proteobacteria bacterium]|nr:hypothetical protein [Pseudomonadota bacterium]